MKIKYSLFIMLVWGVSITSCNRDTHTSDAYGSFEAREVMVSAEASGKLMRFSIEEGQELTADAVVGYVDTTQLYLRKQQLRSMIRAVLSKKQVIQPQTRVYEEQKANLQRESNRVEKLLAEGAATQKQFDDLKGQLELVEKQMIAHITTLNTANQGISGEVEPLLAQIRQVEDQIAKSILRNPIAGQVLTQYAEEGEITTFGRPLYKVADVNELILRIYIQGEQLDDLKIGQAVEVLIDSDSETYHRTQGTVTWVSSQAEFTPRSIHTKAERATLVYAAKVKVKNDGKLKIGMPGEVNFNAGVASN
ncbi:MAG: HlyD family efflux transporter periplasmic adaptor subunit [Bacteroidia bacterium]|nr:HlyD family efflux transporter periplasmic adaptor subunit [Bacteroidia bacterium]